MIRHYRPLAALAFALLGACATTPGADTPAAAATTAAAPDAYAGKSVLDAAIAAAGGQEALGKVKELAWTGSATVNAGGKTTDIAVQTVLRPFTYARSTSWPKADGEKAARSIQAENGSAWTIQSVAWNPMPEAQTTHEMQQFGLYGVMLLATLKDPGAKVTETAPGKDGTHNLHVEHAGAQPTDLRFNAAGKLIRAEYSVTDPAGGAAMIPQVVEFSGEVVSNGVKWPKHIAIKENGVPYFDLDIDSFEARPAVINTPLKHTLSERGMPTGPGGN